MKKNVTWFLVTVLILSLIAAVPVFAAAELERVTIVGVPNLLVEEDGVQISSNSGEKLNAVNKDDVVLVGEVDFDIVEQATRDKLLKSTLLPLLHVYEDRDLKDELIDVDPERVALIFDFFFKEGGRELLDDEDGVQANLHFEMMDDIGEDELVIGQYVNNEWVILDNKFFNTENGMLNLNLENEGMLAFFRLKKVRDYLIEKGSETEVIDVPGSEIETPYKSSVERPANPEVIRTEGYHYELETTYIKLIDPGIEIPVDDVKLRSALDFTPEEREAYDKLAKAAENGKLSDACKNLLDILKKDYDSFPEEKLVVSDVFSIEFGPLVKAVLNEGDDTCVQMTFKYSIDDDDTFVVLQYIDGEWVALEAMWITVDNENVSILLLQDGIVAFVVAGE